MGNLDILLDGQFGSCGKGSVVSRIASNYNIVIRSGSIQAGHIHYVNGQKFAQQVIPCAWHCPNVKLVIAAGAIIERILFEREIQWMRDAGFNPEGRVFIDVATGILDSSHAQREAERAGVESGRASTYKGVGAATADRVERHLPIARDTDWCKPYLADTVGMLNDALRAGENVLVEGTQGTGLSLFTSRWDGKPFYPQCTSREVGPAALMADCGINPGISKYAKIHTIGVMRTYPIRIAGDSGFMGKEITWDEVTKRSGSPKPIVEITTVTKKVRRVAELDIEWTKQMIKQINPSWLVLTFADYIDYQDHGKTKWADLTQKTRDFVIDLEKQLGVPINSLGTGPMPEDCVDSSHSQRNASAIEEPEMESTLSGITRVKKKVLEENRPVYLSKIGRVEGE